MTDEYTLYEDLGSLVDAIQSDSIVSRTFYKDDQLRAILFGFDAGQELSEHTSSQTAVIHIIEGEARVSLGEHTHDLEPGSWVHMLPNLKHSIYAKTPVKMILLMLGKG
ncbi:MAG: cupin [Anaerolineaceae bacterium]|nr:cupin [Anaerolineaceae bacterium]